ncbi:WD repeat-containing protein DWA2 [Acorus calamus]|uniref:WD repeat-containing protein DWA2 n=1 Tax=Acorus calamus TaxID=4465 RepID=A0AAV9D764_ACOCL|nr:WD repeat-containing protein DWA2 [Acorus calamus]
MKKTNSIEHAHIRDAEYNPNKQHILSAGTDSAVYLWLAPITCGDDPTSESLVDSPTRQVDPLLHSYSDYEDSIYGISWSSREPWMFASLSYDGRAKAYWISEIICINMASQSPPTEVGVFRKSIMIISLASAELETLNASPDGAHHLIKICLKLDDKPLFPPAVKQNKCSIRKSDHNQVYQRIPSSPSSGTLKKRLLYQTVEMPPVLVFLYEGNNISRFT